MTGTTSETLVVRVANLDCANDAAALQRALANVSGLSELEVRPSSGSVTLTFDPESITSEGLKDRLAHAGHPVVDRSSAVSPAPWPNRRVLASAASGVLLVVGWVLASAGVAPAIPVGVYVLAMLVGGYDFAREGFGELFHERHIGIEFLMTTAAIAAAAMGAPGEGATLVFLYSISEAAEGYTAEKTRSAIRALMKLVPPTALLRRGDDEVEVPAEEVQPGDIFIVRPGGSIPTDGIISSGHSALDEAPVTGESIPVEKAPGDTVLAGTINQSGALEVRATKGFADNTVSRIITLVEQAQERKGTSQTFIERFGHRYSPLVLLGGALAALVPPLAWGASWAASIQLGTILLVAAAPCALVISIPITLVGALGTGARRGILIKGGIFVEELARIRSVALDKTGTLTVGKPAVTDVVAVPTEADSEQLLAVTAAVERSSEHPLARAIVAEAASRGVAIPKASGFQAQVGAGATAVVEGRVLHIGSRTYFSDDLSVDLGPLADELNRLENEGKTLVVVGTTDAVLGVVALRDNLRPEARDALERLRAVGVERVVMLTGDNEGTARAIAAEAGVDEVHAKLKPADKVGKLRELAQRYEHLLMVGDGVNDAPALAEATVGVAMGAASTDVALETADVALMADDLGKLADALLLGRYTQKIIRQNLALSVIVIGGTVAGAIAGWFTLPIVVLVHEISEFVVIGNGLRVLGAPTSGRMGEQTS